MNGIVQTYEELKQNTSVGERVPEDFKRLFIYDDKEYSFFLMINPHQKAFIKCFTDELNNSKKINSILNDVSVLLKTNKVSGILNNIFIYIKKIIYLFTPIQNFRQVPNKSWNEQWALQTFRYGYPIEMRRLCMLRAASLLNGQWDVQKYRSDLNRGMTERCLHELMVYSMISKENKMMIMC